MLDQIVAYLGTTKFRVTAVVCIILVIVLFIKLPKKSNTMYRCPTEKIDATISKIVEEKERNLSDRMWLSCKDGLIQGGITGVITGGFIGAAAGGAVFAIVNPAMVYIQE
jgi:hypothetical protein